jgi:phage/plasmid-like protein (TIGR03299 family)
MSQETLEWLNVNTLIGYTDQRKTAWHYREALQGDEPNHYPGAIPVDDLERRLFGWGVVEAEVLYRLPDGRIVESQRERKGMLRDDNDFDLGVFMQGYVGHGYRQWLVEKVESVIDDSLNVGSAGLLKNGAQAWVSIEMPENMTAAGVDFRPHLIACTSFDGSLSTTYKRAIQFVVCDNTLAAGLGEAGQVFKVKHSRYSNAKLNDVRDALAIVHTMGEDFAEELEALASWSVSDKAFERHVELMVPKPDQEGRSMTTATKKQNQLIQLWRADERVAPWRGTALGVVQAYNTWQHHVQGTRGEAGRAQRNMENVINGRFATQDAKVLSVLAEVAPVVAA